MFSARPGRTWKAAAVASSLHVSTFMSFGSPFEAGFVLNKGWADPLGTLTFAIAEPTSVGAET